MMIFMIKIEHGKSIIMIQIPNSRRLDFINSLKSVGPEQMTELNASTGERVIFERSEEFLVDVRDTKKLILRLPNQNWIDLIEAVAEHLEEVRDLPLNHSFEPYGAKIVPDSIEDVIVETIAG